MVKTERPTLTWEDLPRRARNAANTRVALFECARDALEQRSFDQVTVKSLCEQVGVTEPTFFNHFGEKSDLLVYGIMLWGIESAWKLSRLPAELGPIARIDWLFSESARSFAERPGFAHEILARQATRRGPPKFIEITLAERLRAFPEHEGIEKFPGQGIVGLLTPLVRRAKRRALLPDAPSADVVIQTLVSTFFGVPTFTLWEDPQLVGRRYRQQLRILWRGMGVER
jgi:AcrR family transcriptional regulator